MLRPRLRGGFYRKERQGRLTRSGLARLNDFGGLWATGVVSSCWKGQSFPSQEGFLGYQSIIIYKKLLKYIIYLALWHSLP